MRNKKFGKLRFFVAFMIALGVLFALFIGFFLYGRTHGILILDGKIVQDIEIVKEGTTLNLPVIALLEHLGYKFVQEQNQVVALEKNGRYFELNLAEKTLVEEGNGFGNFLLAPPGADEFYCEIRGEDIYLDAGTMDVVFSLMGEEHYVVAFPAVGTVLVDNDFYVIF